MALRCRLLAAVSACTLMTACTQPPPACGDVATLTVLKDILREQIVPAEFRTIPQPEFHSRIEIKLPAPTGFDKDIARYQCQATLVVDAARGVDQIGRSKLLDLALGAPMLISAAADSVQAGRFEISLVYESQRVEGQHLVRISDVSRVNALLIGSFVAAHTELRPATVPDAAERAQDVPRWRGGPCNGLAMTDAHQADGCEARLRQSILISDREFKLAMQAAGLGASSESKQEIDRLQVRASALDELCAKSKPEAQEPRAVASLRCQHEGLAQYTSELRALSPAR